MHGRSRLHTWQWLLVLLVGTVLWAAPATGSAQNAATPAASIKQAALGRELSAVAPDRVLLLARRTFAPGADSGAHSAAGPVVLYVDAGAVEFTVVQGAALVIRAGSTATDPVAAGSTVTLNVGDEVSYDQGVIHGVRNGGTVPAITLEARLNPRT